MSDRTWVENNPIDSDSNIWDKDAEPELQGKLIKLETNVGPNASNLYSVQKDNDEVVKIWGSTVLDDRFLGVRENTYVKVSFEGKKKGKTGKEYNAFKVFVDQDSAPQDDTSQGEPPFTEADLPEGF